MLDHLHKKAAINRSLLEIKLISIPYMRRQFMFFADFHIFRGIIDTCDLAVRKFFNQLLQGDTFAASHVYDNFFLADIGKRLSVTKVPVHLPYPAFSVLFPLAKRTHHREAPLEKYQRRSPHPTPQSDCSCLKSLMPRNFLDRKS